MARVFKLIGYFAALIAVISLIGNYFWDPKDWKIWEKTFTPWLVSGLVIMLFLPVLKRCSLSIRRWLFRKFIVDLTPEVKKFVWNLRPQKILDYELHGPKLMKEGYRHVSARIETMQIILEGLRNAQESEDDLRNIGSEVGCNFVDTTWSQMEEHVMVGADISKPLKASPEAPISKEEVERRLNLWADMEKTAGWGEFRPNMVVVSDGLAGNITVVDCFLTVGKGTGDVNLCAFLEGYIEAIASGLTGYQIIVREGSCGRSIRVDKNCVFRISPHNHK